MSELAKAGVPAWVLFGILHRFGASALDTDKFEACAETWMKERKGRPR